MIQLIFGFLKLQLFKKFDFAILMKKLLKNQNFLSKKFRREDTK